MKSLLLCILALLMTCTRTSAATIQVLSPSQSLNVGASFTAMMEISGLGSGVVPSVGTFDIDLGFDLSLVSFTSASYGTGLDIFALGDIRSTTLGLGKVNLFELSLDSSSDLNSFQPASFILATIKFTALANGTSQLFLNINTIGDAYGNALTVTLQNGSVDIGSAPSVPEPPTFALLAGGLIVLTSRRTLQKIAKET